MIPISIKRRASNTKGAYVLTFLGAAGFMATGYLGGELTLRFGIGIEPGANVNASSPFERRAEASKEPIVS